LAKTDRRTGSVVDVALAPAVSDTAAPTVAEISAGTRLEDYIVGSFSTPRSGSAAEIGGLSDRETFYIAATIDNGTVTIPMWREFDGTDTAWAALDDTANPPTNQYLVVSRAGFTGAAGAPVSTDVCDVYTVQVISRQPADPDKTAGQQFEAVLAVSDVAFDSVVAA